MIVELQKAFKHIQYFDEEHVYINTITGERLPSVTGHIKKFQPEFQEDYWLNIKSQERGITKEELKKEWQLLADYGKCRGQYVHTVLEHRLNNKHFVYPIPETILKYKVEVQFKKDLEILIPQIESFLEEVKLIPIKNELIVGNNSIAGQLDLLCYYNDKLCIFDFKTDKELSFHNKYQNMLYPFKELSDCNYNKYRIQLSHYKYLIETNTPLIIEELYIVHFCVNNPTYNLLQIENVNIYNL